MRRGWGTPATWVTVPPALREFDHWGIWKYSPEGDKWPFSFATGDGPVDAHSNLTTFKMAVTCAANYGAGLYFDLLAENPFAGVDLDDCLRQDEDEVEDGFEQVDGVWIHPEALEVVRALGGYCEISPSGEGVKVTLEGEFPMAVAPTPAPWGSVEIYSKRRFWTCTGMRLDTT